MNIFHSNIFDCLIARFIDAIRKIGVILLKSSTPLRILQALQKDLAELLRDIITSYLFITAICCCEFIHPNICMPPTFTICWLTKQIGKIWLLLVSASSWFLSTQMPLSWFFLCRTIFLISRFLFNYVWIFVLSFRLLIIFFNSWWRLRNIFNVDVCVSSIINILSYGK